MTKSSAQSLKSGIHKATPEAIASLLENTVENSRVDLGHSFVITGLHSVHGQISIFNSAEGMSAFIVQ